MKSKQSKNYDHLWITPLDVGDPIFSKIYPFYPENYKTFYRINWDSPKGELFIITAKSREKGEGYTVWASKGRMYSNFSKTLESVISKAHSEIV